VHLLRYMVAMSCLRTNAVWLFFYFLFFYFFYFSFFCVVYVVSGALTMMMQCQSVFFLFLRLGELTMFFYPLTSVQYSHRPSHRYSFMEAVSWCCMHFCTFHSRRLSSQVFLGLVVLCCVVVLSDPEQSALYPR
jgi:hypothetical protein